MLNASGFAARYFIELATDSTSESSPICKSEAGDGAKSWMFGAPITTGIAPTTKTRKRKAATFKYKDWILEHQMISGVILYPVSIRQLETKKLKA